MTGKLDPEEKVLDPLFEMTFPLKHHIIEDKKEVWIVCNSSITAKGIPALMGKYFPDYTACLCSSDTLQKIINEGRPE